MKILSHRAARKRLKPSLPARIAVQLTPKPKSIFDFGCGKGDDIRFFQSKGIEADGFDPCWKPRNPDIESADLITCFYVLNCVLPGERKRILAKICRALPKRGRLLLAVRSASSIRKGKRPDWKKHSDGYITKLQTFEKGFTSREVRRLLEENGFLASKVLFCDGNSIIVVAEKQQIGKVIFGNIYVHRDYLRRMPCIEEVVVRELRRSRGMPKGWNLVKINRNGNTTFLCYPGFYDDPHPGLLWSYSRWYQGSSLRYYRNNRPILHTKELFVGKDHPQYELFRRLTEQERIAGLLSASNKWIGFENEWLALLERKGLRVMPTHKLVRVSLRPNKAHFVLERERYILWTEHTKKENNAKNQVDFRLHCLVSLRPDLRANQGRLSDARRSRTGAGNSGTEQTHRVVSRFCRVAPFRF